MIFMLIAGTYTPLALHGLLGTATLMVVWAGALAGVVFELVWIDALTWRFAVAYIALGCPAVLVCAPVSPSINEVARSADAATRSTDAATRSSAAWLRSLVAP
jgi:channel protein (hemolysin III family)